MIRNTASVICKLWNGHVESSNFTYQRKSIFLKLTVYQHHPHTLYNYNECD